MNTPERKSEFFLSARGFLYRLCKWICYAGLGLGLLALAVDVATGKKRLEIPLLYGFAGYFVSVLCLGCLVNVFDGLLRLAKGQRSTAIVCFTWALFLLVITVICFVGALGLHRRFQN